MSMDTSYLCRLFKMTLRALWCLFRKYVIGGVASHPQYFWVMATLYFITFVILLPWMCNDWAYSAYMSTGWKHSELLQRARVVNRRKLAQAKQFLAGQPPAETLNFYENLSSQDELELAIGVVTVERVIDKDVAGFLTRVMSKLHGLFLNDTQFSRKMLTICNVHAGPGKNREALRMSEYFLIRNKFEKKDTASLIMDHFEKEKQDYVFCLEELLEYKPRYVLVMEDDAVARDDLFVALRHALDTAVETRWRSGDAYHDGHDRWASLKLYYPEKWQGFESSIHSLLELVALGCILGMASVGFLYLGRSTCTIRTAMPLRTEVLAFTLGALYAIIFACMVGRPYLLELHRLASPYLYRVIPAPECCSPGILYPAHVASSIAKHLKRVSCSNRFPLDLAIDNFIHQHHYSTHLIEPNLVRHVGFVSSTKSITSHPEMFIY